MACRLPAIYLTGGSLRRKSHGYFRLSSSPSLYRGILSIRIELTRPLRRCYERMGNAVGVRFAALIIRLAYSICCLFPQQKKIVLLSRQSARPFDFALLEPELKKRFPAYSIVWACVPKIGKMGPFILFKQVWHVATAKICLVDGYIPAVSIPRSHRAFVAQVWHAPGAIKKFGYQSLGTRAGRSEHLAQAMRMHRGYDVVVAGMPGAVEAFSQAFDVPVSSVLPLGLPRIDYLRSDEFASARNRRAERARAFLAASSNGANPVNDSSRVTVLYAPTFRKGSKDPDWLHHAVGRLSRALHGFGVSLVVAGHPLEHSNDPSDTSDVPVAFVHGIPTIDLFDMADYVVTDYSTVAFEAGYAHKKVLFYVPDIDEYRLSPGLNIDVLEELPTLAFKDASELARILTDEMPYDREAFNAFMSANAGGVYEGAVDRICNLLESHTLEGAKK